MLNTKPEKKLGFGLMRLPKLEDDSIDIEQVKTMVDEFIAAGGTYFDTAYVYGNGASEEAAREALVKRYPRDSFTIATKLNAMVANDEADAKAQFGVSCERLGVDYIDFYLLHNLNEGTVELYDRYNLWEYLRELKAEGKIKNLGFSYHGKPALLRELFETHPEVDFCQLQVNYADWNDNNVCSGENVSVCNEFGIPYVVMEPVKGGSLAAPPEPVSVVFTAADANASLPSWAIRFAASQEGVLVVLSGMSNKAQMEDNLSYMAEFKPLSTEENEVVARAQAAFDQIEQIKCTACSYCTDGCPMSIPIPATFTAMNRYLIWDNLDGAKDKYARETEGKGLASQCIQCGQCEAACPQHLPIIELLQKVAETLE